MTTIHSPKSLYGTTILGISREGQAALGSDGQVTLGDTADAGVDVAIETLSYDVEAHVAAVRAMPLSVGTIERLASFFRPLQPAGGERN